MSDGSSCHYCGYPECCCPPHETELKQMEEVIAKTQPIETLFSQRLINVIRKMKADLNALDKALEDKNERLHLLRQALERLNREHQKFIKITNNILGYGKLERVEDDNTK